MSEETTPEQILAQAQADGAFKNAALVVRRDGRNLVKASVGADADADAVYDVASLSKILTAALALGLRGPERKVSWLKGTPTVADLLAHRSGLAAWEPLFAQVAQRLDLPLSQLITDPSHRPAVRLEMRALLSELEAKAPKPTYSDLGFMALGFEVEENAGETLPELAKDYFFEPLGLKATVWGGEQEKAVRTGKGRPRPGNPDQAKEIPDSLFEREAKDFAVDDDNAAILGGKSGHAGLWSTAEEMAKIGENLRLVAAGAPSALFTPKRIAELFTVQKESGRTLGLDTPAKEGSALGSILGKGKLGAVGHLGFTGCSLWIDRDAELTVVLLSDAVAVERPNLKIRKWRPLIHDVVAKLV